MSSQSSYSGTDNPLVTRLASTPVKQPVPYAVPPQGELNARRIWIILVHGRWWVLGITGVLILIALALTLNSRMSFKTSGSLYLGDTLKSDTAFNDRRIQDLVGAPGNEAVGNELEIIKSRELVTQAILKAGINAPVTLEGEKPPRMWQWLLHHRDPRLVSPPLHALRAIDAQATDPALLGKKLQIRFLTQGNYHILDAGNRPVASGRMGKPLSGSGLRLILLPAHPHYTPPAGAKYTLRVTSPDQVYETLMLKFKATVVQSSPTQDLNVIRINLTGPSPYENATFVNQLMQGYLSQHLRWKTEDAAAMESFIDEQLQQVKTSLVKADQQLAAMKRHSGVVLVEGEANAMIRQSSDYEMQRAALQLKLKALDAISNTLRQPGARLEAYLVSQTGDEVLTGMRLSLVKAQEELGKMRTLYTDRAPELQQAKAQVQQQQEAIASYITNQRKLIQGELANLGRLIGGFDAQMKTLPEVEARIISLSRSVEVLSKLYTFLLEKQKETNIAKAAGISKNRILESAIIPPREISPKLPLNLLLGTLVGVILGTIFVFGRRKFANTIQDEAEVREQFAVQPLSAFLPHQDSPRGKPFREGDIPFTPVLEGNPVSSPAEAYRFLGTSLCYTGMANWGQVILVTSSAPQDGKTTITLNLAYALAFEGRRVLVIDAEMRKPSHHQLLNLSQEPGLSAVLAGERNWRNVVQPVLRGQLDAITTGRLSHHPVGLLSSSRLAGFLAEIKEEYDVVLIDSPPFPLVSDAMILARHADRVLTIVRMKHSPKGPLEEHIRWMSANVKHHDLVLNDVALDEHAYGYYGYGINTNSSS